MVKDFIPRISKKERKVIDLSSRFDRDIFKTSDEKLLKGAKLDEVRLETIHVKDQVRTKFNDDSIRDLAENIKENGLIQPLVIHLKDGRYTLICGERRYRAMTSITMEKAPCFILENKTNEELMAIQFSENSSREALHYIDKADGVYNYQHATNASERKIVVALGISKSEVHRSLILAKLSSEVKEAAKKFDVEKYVLLECDELEEGAIKSDLMKQIENGFIRKRSELQKFLRSKNVKKRPGVLKRETDVQDFLDIVNSKNLLDQVDEETRQVLQKLSSKVPKKEIGDSLIH